MATLVKRGLAVPTETLQNIGSPNQPVPIYDFAFTDFLEQEYKFGADPSRPVCKAFEEGHCPLGNRCLDKHHRPSSLVCKHWLKALCKKGDQCEYLHEYNLRRMPECTHYPRSLICPNGDECLYRHIDPASKVSPCPHYDKGFCPLGPRCSKKHVRKTLCRFYMAGFCPYGRQCKEGAHPRWPENLPKPTVKVEKSPEELERERNRIRDEGEREAEREWERRDGNRREGRGRGKGRYNQRRRGVYDR